VRVDVRFQDIPQVSLNQPVQIQNPALAAPLTGQVLFVSSEADIQKNTLQVKVAIPDPPPVLKPEMLVDVTFLSPPRSSSEGKPSTEVRLFVPQQLVRNLGGESFVWIADQSAGVARRQPVQTAATLGNGLTEVVSGLTVSARLITSASDSLRDGCRIRIAGEDPDIGTGVDPGFDEVTASRPLP
jgi:multidrug efflux pump subunit AcrA (membrane-fusion protein)